MQYSLVDAFADDEHLGNPAAVVEVPELPEPDEMQDLARRIGVPTTAFVSEAGAGRYRVRWYTPHARINVCGHATIASARVLFTRPENTGRVRLVFDGGEGVLAAERVGPLVAIELDAAALTPGPPPPGLLEALGLTDHRCCATSHDDVLVEVATPDAVAAVRPDFDALARLPFRGHIVTAAGGTGTDFVSRTFFPALGVTEDQVCVSAHGKLAPFWADRLGRAALTARQLSERGGRLEVEARGDLVRVIGSAVPRGGPRHLDRPGVRADAARPASAGVRT